MSEVITTRTTAKMSGANEEDGEGEQCNVKVMVRVRPFSTKEIGEEQQPTSVVYMDAGNKVSVLDPAHAYAEKEAFQFDTTFWSLPPEQNQYTDKTEVATQETVFAVTGKPIVDAALKGYNGTIFAYGQTGSGKTHTMFGSLEDPGITLRLLQYLFDRCRATETQSTSTKITIEISFLEIYNEKVRDLLDPQVMAMNKKKRQSVPHNSFDSSQLSPGGSRLYSRESSDEDLTTSPSVSPSSKAETRDRAKSTTTNNAAAADSHAECKVRYHPSTGTYVEGLRRENVQDLDACRTLLRFGMEHRAVAATKMNDTSSRSHAVLQLVVKQKDSLKGSMKVSLVNLVDLAGSERVKASGVQGKELTEAKNINLSLTTLRRVIDILIENSTQKKKLVPPYRESMLTWLLSESLGGNSRTIMLTTVSPAKSNLEDTIGTLRYANKAKAIVCRVHVNEQRTAVVVGALKAEMEELRKQLKQSSESNNLELQRGIREELDKLEGEWRVAVEEHHQLEAQRAKIRHEIAQKDSELQALKEQGLSKRLEDAQEVKKLQEAAQDAQRRTEEHARVAQEHAQKRIEQETEIQFQLSRHHSLHFRHQRVIEDSQNAASEHRSLQQQQYASIFKNARTMRVQKMEKERLGENIVEAKQKLGTLELRLMEVRSLHARETMINDRLYKHVTDTESRASKKAQELEIYEDRHVKKEQTLVEQISKLEEQYPKTKVKIAETIANIEKLTELRASNYIQKEIDELTTELKDALSARLSAEESLKEVGPAVEEQRKMYEELFSSTEPKRTIAHDLEEKDTEQTNINTQYDDRLNVLIGEARDVDQMLQDRVSAVASVKNTLVQLQLQRDVVQRAHGKLRAYVSGRCFAHPGLTNPSSNVSQNSSEPFATEEPPSRRYSRQVTNTSISLADGDNQHQKSSLQKSPPPPTIEIQHTADVSSSSAHKTNTAVIDESEMVPLSPHRARAVRYSFVHSPKKHQNDEAHTPKNNTTN